MRKKLIIVYYIIYMIDCVDVTESIINLLFYFVHFTEIVTDLNV